MVREKKKQENQVSLVHTLHRILAFQTANSTHPASHNDEFRARQRDQLISNNKSQKSKDLHSSGHMLHLCISRFMQTNVLSFLLHKPVAKTGNAELSAVHLQSCENDTAVIKSQRTCLISCHATSRPHYIVNCPSLSCSFSFLFRFLLTLTLNSLV